MRWRDAASKICGRRILFIFALPRHLAATLLLPRCCALAHISSARWCWCGAP
jgi:hypothetical protein